MNKFNSVLNEHNIMIDIETLSTHKNAAITAMAAVTFSVSPDFVSSQLKHVIGKQSEGHVSKDTLEWMSKPENKAALLLAEEEGMPPYKALKSLQEFIDRAALAAKEKGKRLYIWGNAPSFDLDIVGNAMKFQCLAKNWHFYQEMDFRTTTRVLGLKRVMPDTPHDPLSDCLAQVETLMNAA